MIESSNVSANLAPARETSAPRYPSDLLDFDEDPEFLAQKYKAQLSQLDSRINLFTEEKRDIEKVIQSLIIRNRWRVQNSYNLLQNSFVRAPKK